MMSFSPWFNSYNDEKYLRDITPFFPVDKGYKKKGIDPTNQT